MQDWIYGLMGGVLIGLAAAILLLGNGRIAGISGTLGSILPKGTSSNRVETFLFLAGLVAAPLLWGLVANTPEINVTSNPALLIIAGFFVGFGSRMGSGCTSGHGVCGLGRFSPRSIVAVLTFMASAILTVAVMNSF